MFRHIIIKPEKTKDREGNLARESQSTTHRGQIQMTADFSSEAVEDRRQQNCMFKVLNEKRCQPGFHLQQKHPSVIKMKQVLSNREKPNGLLASKPALKEMLKEVLHREGKRNSRETWCNSRSLGDKSGNYPGEQKRWFSPLKFFKIYMTIESKTTTLLVGFSVIIDIIHIIITT